MANMTNRDEIDDLLAKSVVKDIIEKQKGRPPGLQCLKCGASFNVGTKHICKTCRNCKWWGDDFDAAYRDCTHKKLNDPYDGPDSAGPSYDPSGFVCGPDFGCIHFKEK